MRFKYSFTNSKGIVRSNELWDGYQQLCFLWGETEVARWIFCPKDLSSRTSSVITADETGRWGLFESDTFKILGPNTITTAKDGLWSDAATWSNGKVPDANTMIILNHPITVDINATCKYLYTFCRKVTVNTGKTVTVTGRL